MASLKILKLSTLLKIDSPMQGNRLSHNCLLLSDLLKTFVNIV